MYLVEGHFKVIYTTFNGTSPCLFYIQNYQSYVTGNSKMRTACLFLLCLLPLLAFSKDKEDDKKDEVGTVIGIDLGTTYSW